MTATQMQMGSQITQPMRRVQNGLFQSVALLCCFMAFLLGVNGLGMRSLWGDEAFSVYASRQMVVTLLSGFDAQPPLYHLTLAIGRVLWGQSEFALRFVSLCCGVVLVAIAARLGRQMGTALSGMLVAFALASSPMAIYFMQEARMYALGAVMAAGAMWMTVLLMRGSDRSRWRWLAYVLFSLGALFTHYYTFGALFANTLALFGSALRESNRTRSWKPLLMWTVSHGAIALIFGAWFVELQFRYFGAASSRRASWIPSLNAMLSNLGRGVNGLVFGMRADPALLPLAIGFVALAVLGIAGWWRWKTMRAYGALILGWTTLGTLIVALTASPGAIVPDFNPRYLLFVLLPLMLAASGWVVWNAELRSWGATLLHPSQSMSQSSLARIAFVLLLVVSPAVYGHVAILDQTWAKSRYGELAKVIRERYGEGDAVVLLNSDQFPLYDYYGPKVDGVWIQSNELWNPTRVAELDQQFDAALAGKSRIWLVNYGDATMMNPRPHVEQRLNHQGARVYSEGFQDATLALYQMVDNAGGMPFVASDAHFGENIQLIGTRLRSGGLKAGDVVTLDLLWRSNQKLSVDYTVFVHLRRVADGAQVAAFDSPPVNGSLPTSRWTPNQPITDTHAVTIPGDAQPGQYELVIGLYQYPTFERLPVNGQDTTEIVAARLQVGD